MDGFTEKKWFVYLGDHHEGAFSIEEIQDKVSQGQLNPTNYIWAEGMPDWKMMSEVESFQSVLGSPTPPPAPPAVEEPAAFESPTVVSRAAATGSEPAFSLASPKESSTQSIMAAPILSSVSEIEELDTKSDMSRPTLGVRSPSSPAHSHNESSGDSRSKRALASQLVKALSVLIVIGGIGFAANEGYLNPLLNSQTFKSGGQALSSAADPVFALISDKVPFLAGIFSPIPRLENVTPEEYGQLKLAAKSKMDQTGPQMAIALDQSDLLDPTFYLGTNLPDGAVFDIYIEGIPDTLMNQLSFSAKTQAAVLKKLARSGTLQFAKGKAFPRGQYKLYVVDPGTQPEAVKLLLSRMVTPQDADPVTVPKGLRVLATKSYFLGGFRDSLYTKRLKDFHDKLTAKAQTELTELKQIATTYEQQLTMTDQKFTALRRGKKPTAAQKKLWNDFDVQWQKLNAQLTQNFSKQTQTSVEADYFYGSLYQLGQQTSDAVTKLHGLQSSYFAGSVQDPAAFDIQLGESSASAHSSVETLKSKIDQVEKLPPTASGLPKRDGF